MPVDIEKLAEYKQKYLEVNGEPAMNKLTEWCLVTIVEQLAYIHGAVQHQTEGAGKGFAKVEHRARGRRS